MSMTERTVGAGLPALDSPPAPTSFVGAPPPARWGADRGVGACLSGRQAAPTGASLDDEPEDRPDLDRLAEATYAVVAELGMSRDDVRLILDEATYQARRILLREGRVDLPNLGKLVRSPDSGAQALALLYPEVRR
jgi:hypothetical protein